MYTLPEWGFLFPTQGELSKNAQLVMGEKILEPELRHPRHYATWKSTHISC